MSVFFSRLAAWAVSRRVAALAAAAFVALLGAAGALRLDTDAETSTLFDRGSESFAATERLHERFGDEAIPVLVRGDLQRIVLTDNIHRLLGLEACLSGNIPEDGAATAPVCERIAESGAVRAVYGPATFLNESAIQAGRFLSRQAIAAVQQARAEARVAVLDAREKGYSEEAQRRVAIAAAQEVLGRLQGELLQLSLATGQQGPPRLDDPQFVSAVVFGSSGSPGTPREDLNSLFPSANAAQVTVRLDPALDGGDRAAAIGLIREAVADPEFQLDGASYIVSGVPVVIEELAGEFRGEVFVLLAAALAVMALVLVFVLGPPMRLLPLALALVAVAAAFGLLSLAGGSLTMASIAVLPVLIGLAVDYAIQFQARHREAVAAGDGPMPAARSAAGRGGPMIVTAAAATVAGFAVLLLSPVPMVRGFGVLLVVGIVVALAAALTAGFAALSAPPPPDRGLRTAGGPRAAALRARIAAAEVAITRARSRTGERLLRAGERTIALAIRAPGRVLAVALVLSAAGWVASTRAEVVSDLRDLVPATVLANAGVDALQEETGVSGELNVVVEAPDLTDPATVAWMRDLKSRVLATGGYEGEGASCERARICPYVFVTDLLGDRQPRKRAVRTLLRALPPYFLRAFIAPAPDAERAEEGSRFAGTANIAFGIRVMPLDDQKRLVDAVRAELDPPGAELDPPEGVSASVAGTPVLAADANAALAASRYWLPLAALAAVAATLLALYRSVRRALVPLVPIAMAIGWSALAIAVTGIPLNPMSATLGALVIAIATEFSVILSARYREEREGGRSMGEALRRTYERTGAAVLASGTTVIAGFAVLPLADPVKRLFGGEAIPMLTEFGLVTVLDLGVALAGVMIVLPAALVWAETRTVSLPLPGRLRRGTPDA